jgi:hypothetical protein
MKRQGAFGVRGLGACLMNGIKYSDVSDANTHGASHHISANWIRLISLLYNCA